MAAPKVILVGHCTASTAQVFCCAELDPARPSPLSRLVWRAGGMSGVSDVPMTAAPPYALAVHHLKDLPASAEVAYTIDIVNADVTRRRDVDFEGAALTHSFRLLPAGRPLRLALVSCNGAHEVDDPAQRYELWRRLKEQIALGRVDLIVHAGDQVYSDPFLRTYVPRLDREGGASADMLEPLTQEYRRVYANTWSVPEVADVLTSCPSVMMWDDHDICDGWGSNDGDERPARHVIFHAARQAFVEFQASHNPPRIDASSFACGFTHEREAILLLDGRSHRSYKDGAILGAGQAAVARDWMRRCPQSLRRLYLVLGVPPVHAKVSAFFTFQKWIPVEKTFAADVRDGWTSPNNQTECAALMAMIFDFVREHPSTVVTILAGDVHVASVGRLQREGALVWQVTASGIGSPPPSGVAGWILKVVTRPRLPLGAGAFGHLDPVMPGENDILLRRNFAVVEVNEDQGETQTASFFAEGVNQPIKIPRPSA
jgi:phosphodiesterase/alkaline phosphatase D-like protein